MLILELSDDNNSYVALWDYFVHVLEVFLMFYKEYQTYFEEIWSSVKKTEIDFHVLIFLAICLSVNIALILISWGYYSKSICNPRIPELVVKYSKLNTKEYKEKAKTD